MANSQKITIGVLALQGAFKLHEPHLNALNVKYIEVLKSKDLHSCDGLIIPGGESATMIKLIHNQELWESLNDFVHSKPVWGICAGAILLASNVLNPIQESFGAIDIEIMRNGYGAQLESHEECINDYKVSFIRAPIITGYGKNIELKHKREERATWVEKGMVMLTTFHPEINYNYPSPWHKKFVDKIKSFI